MGKSMCTFDKSKTRTLGFFESKDSTGTRFKLSDPAASGLQGAVDSQSDYHHYRRLSKRCRERTISTRYVRKSPFVDP